MCPLGSDPFEIIEYIQYYKERRKKIASEKPLKSLILHRLNVCTHYCKSFWMKTSAFKSDSHTYLQSRDVYFWRSHVYGILFSKWCVGEPIPPPGLWVRFPGQPIRKMYVQMTKSLWMKASAKWHILWLYCFNNRPTMWKSIYFSFLPLFN